MSDHPDRLQIVPDGARNPEDDFYAAPALTQADDDADDDAPYEIVAKDDLDGRMRQAIRGIADWYERANAAVGEEESFYWGRQLYHVMRPVTALDRRLRGLAPEHPCTRCGTEEGGASVNVPNPGDSLCAWCAQEGWDGLRDGTIPDPRETTR
jgi:hypothetical protein